MGAQQHQAAPLRRDFSAAQLSLMRRTVGRQCTDPEFDEFMAVAVQCGLDPMRRQITPLIVRPTDPDRRRLIPWATIDGLRVMAARQGDYRPMETAPLIEVDAAKTDVERNPLGVVRAEVRAWKQRDGAWFAVVGEAWWDEFAPVRELPNGVDGHARTVLDSAWARMGRVMIAKCAEAQALRRGWPDVLSGLYGEEELHALRLLDQTASEVIGQRDRLRVNGGEALWFTFDPDEGLKSVPRDEAADQIRSFYERVRSASELDSFHERNRLSLRVFWEWAPGAAFRLKELADARRVTLEAATIPPKRRRPRRAKQKSRQRKLNFGEGS